MILLEIPLEENDFYDLVEKIGPQASTYCDIIRPNNVDGQLIIQAFVAITSVTIPAIVSYLVGRRSKGTIVAKYKGKVDVELTAEINKNDMSEKWLIDYFKKFIEEVESADFNTNSK